MDIRRALIVDDSKLVCFKLSKMLEEKGISSHAVNSGEEALAYLGANPPPDVVFVDIMMPGMDGYQTIEAIRARPPLLNLPIIMCSSNDTDEDRAQAQRRGANGFLPKPPSAEQLFQTLANLSSTEPTAPSTPSTPAGGDLITTEVLGRLTREAVEAAERAVNTRVEDLTHRLALEVEETARRVAGTLAIETSRSVAQRTATETATQIASQTVTEQLRQVATQAASEVAHAVVTELVPNLVLERMRALAATTMPAIAEQAIQEAAERLAPPLLRDLAAPTAETTLRTAFAGIQGELVTQLREKSRADLVREIPDKVARAAATLLEGDSFRLSMTRTVRGVAENVAEQTARSVAETTARTTTEQSLAQAAANTPSPSPAEQYALEALRRIEALTIQSRRATLALGAGLIVVIIYLGLKLLI